MEPIWNADSKCKQFKADIKALTKQRPLPEDELERKKRQLRNRRATIRKSCRPSLLELSPPCDYHQEKRPIARFIAGVLIPARNAAVFPVPSSHRMFLRQLEDIHIPDLGGAWRLILNARFIFGVPETETMGLGVPIVRIRSHVLADILAWFSSHAARPGYLGIA